MFTKQSNRVNPAELMDTFARRVHRLAAVLAGSALLAAAAASAAEGRMPVGGRTGRSARIAELTHQAVAHRGEEAGEGGCLELATMSIMFEPDATEDDVRAMLEGMGDEQFAYFITQSRWTATATDGTVAEGQPMTITYSFVPDGTLIQSTNNGDSAGPSNLFATLDANYPGGRAAWKAAFVQVFDAWSAVSNITYVEVGDDGAGFPLAPGQVGVRGDVRIAMRPLGAGPLAVNYYPSFGGDMVLDSEDVATFSNPLNGFRSLRNTLAHEHGHGLGLQHVLPQNGTKLMEPALNTGFDGPQEDDVRGVQFLYGDWAEANDATEEAEFVGGPLREVSQGVQALTVEDVALERDGAADFYAFTAFAGVPIAIRVEPVGTTYAFGAQTGGAPAEVDAAAARDLAVRLWRRVSAQNNTFQMVAQIDFDPAGEAEYHPPVAYPLGGYFVAEVYSTDGFDDVQRYTLTISNAAIEAPQLPPAFRAFVAGDLGELGDDDTVFFDDTTVGTSSPRTILLANAGAGAMDIGNINIQGPAASDFTFTLLGGSAIAPGAQATLAISFTPSAPGARLAVLSIPNNDPLRSGFSCIVRGTAEAAAAPALEVQVDGVELLPDDAIDLGTIELGQTETAEIRLQNAGTAVLSVTGVQITGPDAADFACSLGSASLSPGASATSILTATPSAPGLRQATLRIVSNDPAGIREYSLLAEGLDPIVDCNANGVDDAEDLATGNSPDCDADGTPDECQADSDADGAIDPCDTHPFDPTDGAGEDQEEFPKEEEDAGDNPDDDGFVDEDPADEGAADDDTGDDEVEEDEDEAQDTDVDDEVENEEEDVDLRPAAGMCGAGAAPALLATLMSLGGLRLAGGRRRA